MIKELTEEEKFVRKELEKVWPQLLINEQKILGTAYETYKGDVMSTAVEYFLQKPIEQQLKTIHEGKLENFITFIANIQAKSSHTKFYGQFRKFINKSVPFKENHIDKPFVFNPYEEDIEDNEKVKCLKKAMKTLDPFERMLVQERIINNYSYEEIQEKYNIHYKAINNGLIKVRKKLRSLCQHLQ